MENDEIPIKDQNRVDHGIDVHMAKAGKYIHDKFHHGKESSSKYIHEHTARLSRLFHTVDEIWAMYGKKRCTTCNGFGFIKE
jgi:hypothetical protein